MSTEKETNWEKLKQLLDQNRTEIVKEIRPIQEMQRQIMVGFGNKGNSGHGNLDEQIACPDCYPKMRDAVLTKEFKNAEYECENCHYPISDVNGIENCPSCGGKEAKPRSRKQKE